MTTSTLSQLASGARGTILKIEATNDMHDRLAALGFRTGASVGVLYSALMGDPRTYIVCGSQVSLRKSEADLILVNH
ncbi:MAG: ferrous iron transport protein A [Gammaproteobacteria bacterium]|nr:ferrous iron transport protein A [Gammaproteobacteria bacterium]